MKFGVVVFPGTWSDCDFHHVISEVLHQPVKYVWHRERDLGDEISPDTCRLWDAKTRQKLDKDRFRQDLGGVEDAYQEVYRRVVLGAAGRRGAGAPPSEATSTNVQGGKPA